MCPKSHRKGYALRRLGRHTMPVHKYGGTSRMELNQIFGRWGVLFMRWFV